jgi:hypothetical protein
MMNGHFVISLDFELHWGVFDVRKVEDYKKKLLQVRPVIKRLLKLADTYEVKLTFSTVGFLFAGNKTELLEYLPKQKPTYTLKKFSPYPLIESIGENEQEDPFHYAKSVIKEIKNNGNHEIGTHTFSHYYCHELGQTVDQFEEDLKAAVAIAKPLDIDLKSIVFPRNMVDADQETDKPYLEVCYKLGLKSFRGVEKAFIYNIHTTKPYHGWLIFKLLRFFDAYINITGNNTYKIERHYNKKTMLNMPSSRLLRAYIKSLKFLEPLKIRRIKKGMKHAAKQGELFHLWWHPHNFGTHTDENFSNLENIFKEYVILNTAYGFKSETMTGLTNKFDSV